MPPTLSEAWRLEPQWENKQRYVRELIAFFKPETPIREIDEARIQDYLTFAQQQPVMIWTGGSTHRRDDPKADKYWKTHPTGKRRSTSTINRYTPILRAFFDRAYKTRDPITGARSIDEIPKIADLPKPKRKARPTPDAVITDLFKLLPEYVNDAIKATLYFGFRKGEVFSLEIHNVDFDAGGVRLEHDRVKDDEDAFLPGGETQCSSLPASSIKPKSAGSSIS